MLRAMSASLLLLALVNPGTAQERAATPRPCGAKKLATADWCATCKRVLGRYDMLENPRECKRCDEPPGKIEYCVRSFPPYFQASCHPQKREAKAFVCCGKLHATPTVVEDHALVRYECKYCKVSAATRDVLEHKPGCSNPFGVTRHCSKSGTSPHVGR